MDNRKLLKFLYKDIDEIENLVTEKGSEGFDEFEIEFIQSRFTGAKQLIQILSEKENKQLKKIRPRPAIVELEEEIVLEPIPEKVEEAKSEAHLSEHEQDSLEELSNFEEELKENEPAEIEVNEPIAATETKKEEQLVEEEVEEPAVVKAPNEENVVAEPEVTEEADSGVELNEAEEVDEANHRLGDSFSKENSVNELLGGNDSQKLEYKISNSPVLSIKAAIGINDRYQYIRELFEGNAETFSKAVGELDNLNSIQEAVSYLQQNYSWKKNDTSLKFVNLVKRRFPNG